MRVAALEREARRALPRETVAALEAIGLVGRHDEAAPRNELDELEAALAAIAELQAWVEEALASCAA